MTDRSFSVSQTTSQKTIIKQLKAVLPTTTFLIFFTVPYGSPFRIWIILKILCYFLERVVEQSDTVKVPFSDGDQPAAKECNRKLYYRQKLENFFYAIGPSTLKWETNDNKV